MTENQKKAHAYLVKLKTYKKEHCKSLEKIEALRFGCMPGAIRYDVDRVQTSPTNKMESLLVESIDQEIKLEAKHKSYLTKAKYVEEVCKSFTNDESDVIRMYYLYDCTFKNISTKIGKTERHIYRIKNIALEKFALHIV